MVPGYDRNGPPKRGRRPPTSGGPCVAASLRDMVQAARVRQGALAQPEVEEGTHLGMAAFFVRGKNFVSV